MKICAIIAEYNPLHLGHLKQIDYVKNVLGAENILVIMSGNFTQRGEPAVMNKFKRARQAVIAGADAVIELPTVFATAGAEIFASGAVKILSDLNAVDAICFGVESGEKEDYLALAKALNDESKEFKKALKAELETGVSFARAKFTAIKKLGKEFDEKLVSSPNNILGVEYARAILKQGNKIELCPMKREGDHNDRTLKKGITSATSIRSVIKAAQFRRLKKNLPEYVYKDLNSYPYDFDKLILSQVILNDAEDMADISDCTEGLNNRIKALSKSNRTIDELVERASTKRYTSARIRRILVSNFLKIKKDFVEECLSSPLYAKVLAANAQNKELISLLAEKSSIPLLTRKNDAAALKKTAAECFFKDVLANDAYNLAAGEKENENMTFFI